MDILKELKTLEKLGLTVKAYNTGKPLTPIDFISPLLRNNHVFMTQPLKEYKLLIWSSTSAKALELKIREAKLYLSARSEYAKKANPVFQSILEEFGVVHTEDNHITDTTICPLRGEGNQKQVVHD